MDQFHTVDWVEADDNQNQTRIYKQRQSRALNQLFPVIVNWLALALSGLVIGCASVIITLSSTWFADIRTGHCKQSWYLNESLCCLGENEGCEQWSYHHWSIGYLVYIVLSVLFALTASFLVTYIEPNAAGSGISEIKCIVSGFFNSSFLSLRTLAVKVVALPLTIASGFSVGKEGPSVHYAAAVGNVVPQWLMRLDSRDQSEFIAACCGAGVSVAFGSPIGGVLFAIEEMSTESSLGTIWQSYFCSLVAISVVAALNPYRTGQVVLFSVQYDQMWHFFDVPFFVLIGIFGGIAGNYIKLLNLRVVALRKKYWGKYVLAEALLISLLTSLICYWNPFLRVDMTRSMQELFQECEEGKLCSASHYKSNIFSLLFALVIRSMLLIVSYGAAKVPAGIFVPSLAIGALFGRLIGTSVAQLKNTFPTSWMFASCGSNEMCVNPGAYALLGAGALLTGVMHITLTVVVIIFELTGALHYILPTMIVVSVTKMISDWFGGEGIADMAIEINNLPYIKRTSVDDTRTARDIMIPRDECIMSSVNTDQTTLEGHYCYPLLDENGLFIGALTKYGKTDVPISVRVDQNIEEIREIFAKLGPHTIFVLENSDFMGLITQKDFLRASHNLTINHTIVEEKVGQIIEQVCEKISSLMSRILNLHNS